MKQKRIAYLDCFAGVSGDMVLGALLDLGLPLEVLDEGWRKLGLKGFQLNSQKVQRGGLMGIKVEVQGKGTIKNYREMRAIINDSPLPTGIKELSVKILQKLAQVEAAIHGVEVDKVHFHEIGGIDTIVDAVGAALGVSHFKWDSIICSPLPLNRGFVEGGARPPSPACSCYCCVAPGGTYRVCFCGRRDRHPYRCGHCDRTGFGIRFIAGDRGYWCGVWGRDEGCGGHAESPADYPGGTGGEEGRGHMDFRGGCG